MNDQVLFTNKSVVQYIPPHSGSDVVVVNAARASFGREINSIDEPDRRLLHYLAKEGHWTPFAHPHITFRISTPLSVARQIFKHKVGFTENDKLSFVENEESRRYLSDPPSFYLPDYLRNKPKGNIKQGSENTKNKYSDTLLQRLVNLCSYSDNLYQEMIVQGVCPEQARFALPQNMMTTFVMTGSLAAWFRMYSQRLVGQKETKEIAVEIFSELEKFFPESCKALKENTLDD